MTPLSTVLIARAALVVAALVVGNAEAGAVGMRTRMACASDYFKHCSQFSPASQEVRQCMRAVGPGLSKGCVAALLADGEVSQAEVARRKAQSRTAAR